ncbi:hypothetical protein [Streptomyces longwoodensis]
MLVYPGESRGERKVHLQRDEDGRIVGVGGEDQEDDTDAAAESVRSE